MGALRFGDGLVLALNVASYTGWTDGEPASFANDDLAFSLVYKQLFK
jgi:hypothetical protein